MSSSPPPAEAPKPSGALGAFTALDWIGVALVALVALGLLGAQFAVSPAFVQMYAEFGDSAVLPLITRIVLAPWFALLSAMLPLGLLGAAIFGGGGLALRRGLVVAGFVLGVVAVGVYTFGVYAPIRQLADAVAE